MKIKNSPLYQNATPKYYWQDSNLGLLFDKFFDCYNDQFTDLLTTGDYNETINAKVYFLNRINYLSELVYHNNLNSYKKYLDNLKQQHKKEKQLTINEKVKKEEQLRNERDSKNKDKLNKAITSLSNTIEILNNHLVVDDKKIAYANELTGLPQPFFSTLSRLTAYCEKQSQLTKAQQGDTRIYALDWHLVTGTGNPHPVENGFLWHYTLGVLYLSGSQVKGLVRSVIEQYYDLDNGNNTQTKQQILHQWFGSDAKDPKQTEQNTQVGELIFFDALPTVPPTLSVDIMTPHMGNWYAKGGSITDVNESSDELPADWHDPVPIPFLAVKECSFLFSIGKRAGSDIDIAEVFACLNLALQYLGAGAKTQVGYGYMQLNHSATQKLQDEFTAKQAAQAKEAAFLEATANASELYKQLLQTIGEQSWATENDTAKHAFTTALTGEWLVKLENQPNEKDCIKKLHEIAQIHYAKQMKNPDHKSVKPNQRDWIKRLLALLGANP